MRNPETMLRVYEELANRFVKQNEPRFRDHCLVLAADAALSAGKAPEAERLRQVPGGRGQSRASHPAGRSRARPPSASLRPPTEGPPLPVTP